MGLRIDSMRAAIAKARGNRTVVAVAILVGGTASAHLITAISMPVITRLYRPEDMSTLAVFVSLLTISYLAICLRFDVALAIPDKDEDAINLLALGASSAVLLSALLGIVVLALPGSVYEIAGLAGFRPFAWYLPPAVMIAGFYSLLQFWFVRRQAFSALAHSRIGQSAAAAATQITMGALGIAPLGLIIGSILNTGAGAFILGGRLWRREREVLRQITWAGMREMFRAYSRFPKFSATEALANAAAVQLPVVVIAAIASGPEAGYVLLALIVIQAPMSLLGTALGQVYLSEAPTRYRNGDLGTFTSRVIGGLLGGGVGPLLFLAIVSPQAFGYVFGAEWARAGILVTWMTPWFVFQLLGSPVSYALHVTNHQKAGFILQVSGLFLRVGSVVLAGLVAANWVSEAYAVSGLVFYLVHLHLVLRFVGSSWSELGPTLRKTAPLILLWAALGGILSGALFLAEQILR